MGKGDKIEDEAARVWVTCPLAMLELSQAQLCLEEEEVMWLAESSGS